MKTGHSNNTLKMFGVSKCQKLSNATGNLCNKKQQTVTLRSLNDLPDELQLKIYNHLTIKVVCIRFAIKLLDCQTKVL